MPRFSRTNCAALAVHVLRHFVRPARVRLSYVRYFRRCSKTRCAHARLVNSPGRWRCSRVLWRRAGLLLEHRAGYRDDSSCALYAPTGAGRLSPYCGGARQCGARSIKRAAAALLNDLASALDASLVKELRYPARGSSGGSTWCRDGGFAVVGAICEEGIN